MNYLICARNCEFHRAYVVDGRRWACFRDVMGRLIDGESAWMEGEEKGKHVYIDEEGGVRV
jgi:hypothetical protein